MKTIPHEDFPPPGTFVIDRNERGDRVVLLHKTSEHLEIVVWLREIKGTHPTVLGGWYGCPDAGLDLTREDARALLLALTEVLSEIDKETP